MRDDPARCSEAASPLAGRVLLVGVDLELSGCGRFIVTLATGLRRAGWDARVFTIKGGPLSAELTERGVPVTVVSAGGRPLATAHSGALSLVELRREIARHRPDVVHTNLFGADLVGRLARLTTRRPFVLLSTQHDSKPRKRWVVALRRMSVPVVDATAACSPSVAQYCSEVLCVPAERLVVIENGIEAAHLVSMRREPRRSARVVALGSLVPDKGFETLLRAFEVVARARPDARLVIAGKGPLEQELLALSERLGIARSVQIRPPIANVEELFREADVYVSSSVREGLSLALLEAMASGVPVVATDIPANAHVLDHGRFGTLVPPRPQELARAILSVLEDPHAQELGMLGRQRVLERYTCDRMVAEYVTLYRTLCEQGRSVARRRPASSQ